MGEYKPGNDPVADEAVHKQQAIRAFLNQATDDLWDYNQSLGHLAHIASA
jgi:type III secretion protein N (ATPase)